MVLSARGDALDTWTKQTSGVAQNLYGVAYGNHQYLCVGQSGVILVSSNGTAWQPVSSGVTNDLLAITFAAGQFLAVGKWGAIVRSTNGASWETQNSSTTNQLNGILVLEKASGKVQRVVDGTITSTVLDLPVNSASEMT